MIGLVGKKIGMSQVFLESGELAAVSIIQAGPCPILQVKDDTTDGYRAVQLGFGNKKKTSKPMAGHLKKSNTKSAARIFEIRINEPSKYKVGGKIDATIFATGDKVSVVGWTKGRGFSGGMRRWGWSGGPASHGSMAHRRIGSSGAGSAPGRIWKNKTMPGRYGNEQITVKNLTVVKIDKEKNMLYLKGAVPGARNSFLIITKDE
ncbi:50S ribosomal protein L3 [candidate division WOR_3 bacterium SM23_42]|uniref:Large ribosomal subunit protein uL3 n=1 Tax=candidate division WOR_3 bacterium SM23_42 TaxID=1703779 RepID=A0A0S8FS49_UNCW3|nr:MAG: 50S ribosomal protein L3 [candidate division WOR_3 bacterium SM23_42]